MHVLVRVFEMPRRRSASQRIRPVVVSWRAILLARQDVDPLVTLVELAERPPPPPLLRVLIMSLILRMDNHDVVRPKIQKPFQPTHHPRQADIRQIRISIPSPDVTVHARKPHLLQIRLLPCRLLPQRRTERTPILIQRQRLKRVIDDRAQRRVVETVLLHLLTLDP